MPIELPQRVCGARVRFGVGSVYLAPVGASFDSPGEKMGERRHIVPVDVRLPPADFPVDAHPMQCGLYLVYLFRGCFPVAALDRVIAGQRWLLTKHIRFAFYLY